jgi:uncharacterized protein YPO0396
VRGSLPFPGAGAPVPIDAGPINGKVETANSLGAMLRPGATQDATELNTLEGELAKMKALGAESGQHVDAFKKKKARFDTLLKATNGPAAETGREFSTAVGAVRTAAKRVPEAMTRVDKERAKRRRSSGRPRPG